MQTTESSRNRFRSKRARRSQTEYTIDADEAKIFDRGNTKTTLAFEIERAHGSEADAEKFAVGHASEIAALSPPRSFSNTQTALKRHSKTR